MLKVKLEVLSLLVVLTGGCGLSGLVGIQRNNQSEAPRSSSIPVDEKELVISEPDSVYAPVVEISDEERIRMVQDMIGRAVKVHKAGDADGAQNELDAASLLLSGCEVGMESEPELFKSFVEAIKSLEEEYKRLIPDVSALSAESPLSVFLEGMDEEVKGDGDLHQFILVSQIAKACDIQIDYNMKVKRTIEYFQTKAKEIFRQRLRRSGRYLGMMRGIFEEEGLPLDLIYLSMIESGFKPQAYSKAGAAGLWQFIPSTGLLYGLRRDWGIDERRDPIKSTVAAARHLKDLYTHLEDWRLAVAAYNCGRGRLNRAVSKAKSRNFWDLDLPRETKNFVPAFMAAVVMSKNPEAFGFDDLVYDPPMEYDEVEVPWGMSLLVAAECAGTSYQEIKSLNPELRRNYVPMNVKSYRLMIPKGAMEKFVLNYDELPSSKKVIWQRYRIKRGDSIWCIARKFNTSQKAIVYANSLKNPNRIRHGKYLMIPVPDGKIDLARLSNLEPAQYGGYDKDVHLVVKGDNLTKIALMYGTSTNKLLKLNGMSARQYIHPGDRIILREQTDGDKDGKASKTLVIYTVEKGDNLTKIALMYGTSTNKLLKLNGMSARQYIHPGDRIILREQTDGDKDGKASKTLVIYTVEKGDTLWEISLRLGIGVKDIATWNGIHKLERIYPGDKLKIWR